ncbi:MAG: hypothetical protein K6E10_05705 [Eubacterium sp.]|nr:hypothetical protein [Eubacterium sp.]
MKYILIDTGSESNKLMMSDVGKMENAIQRTKTYETGNKILDNLIRIHFSYAINQRINLPFKSIWNKWCVLDKLTLDDNYEYFIVIVNNAIHRLSVKHLNELQKRDNIHIYSLLLDPFLHLPLNVQKQIKGVNWEKIYSFQKSDCLKFNFTISNNIYSKVDIALYGKTDSNKTDVYFVGLAKDRMDKIYKVYKRLADFGLACDFNVIVDKRVLDAYKSKYTGINFKTSRIPYGDVLKSISATRCILEICSEGQDGLTMRFYEAVFYNKMLITNNITAKQSDYYNDTYMQVIENYKDIDLDRIVNTDVVDYKYDGRYSPVNFLQTIVNDYYEYEKKD